MKTIIGILTIILGIMIVNQSCSKIFGCKDEVFSFQRQENNTNKFKLNGYYYEYYEKDEMATKTNLDVIFLNQNGILFYALGQQKDKVLIGDLHIKVNDLKPFWGIYRISNNDIEIEYWFPQSNGCVKVENQKGVILNDSTFKITSIKTKDTDEKSVNNVFRFKQYSPKPDSTVSFIP